MAPEVVKTGYSESSDVWSVGCVLFELVTTWLYNKDEAITKLQEVKENPEELNIIFDKICTHYSDSLITVLGMMLNTKKKTNRSVGLLAVLIYLLYWGILESGCPSVLL